MPRILMCLLACGLFTFVTAQPEDPARIPLQKGHTLDILTVKLSPNELFLIAIPGTRAPTIWNWSNGKQLRSLGKEASYVDRVVFSPDSQLVVTSDISGDILLWSVTTGRLLRKFDNGPSGDDALAFRPDGLRLASGGNNQNIVMWDVNTGKQLWHLLPVR